MGAEPDFTVRIADDADTVVKVIGDQVLDLAGAAAGEVVVVGLDETLDTRVLADGDIPAAIARDAEVTAAVAAEATARAAAVTAEATARANAVAAEATARDAAIAAAVPPLFLQASRFSLVTGTPSLGNANSNTPWYQMDSTTIEAVATTVEIPSGWATAKVELIWSNNSASVGDVVWRLNSLSAGDGESVETAASSGDVTAAAPTQYIRKTTQLAAALAVTPGETLLIRVQRRASDVADTLANDACILGVRLTKAS